jgi:hypothetical protein
LRIKVRVFKITGIVLGAFVLLFVIALFIIQNKVENIIEKKLEIGILPGYSLQYGQVGINLFSGSASIDSLVVFPDKAFVGEPFAKGMRIDSLFVPGFKIGHVGLFRYLFCKDLTIGKIALFKPRIYISIKDNQRSTKQNHKAFDKVRKLLLRTFLVENMELKVRQMSTGKCLYSIADFSVTARGLEIEEKDGVPQIKYPFIKKLDITSFSALLSNGLYQLSVKKVEMNSASKVHVNGFKLTPQLNKADFFKSLGLQTDRIALDFEELHLSGLDFKALQDKVFRARKIKLSNVYTDFYRDKNFPPPENHFPPLPATALKALDFDLCIDSLFVDGVEAHYAELMPEATKAGSVFFKDLNVLMVNLNNNPEKFKVRNRTNVYATGALMGESLIRVKLEFPVKSAQDTIAFSGAIENFNLKSLNSMLMPNQMVEIVDGQMDELIFDAKGNNDFANGNLEFLYHGLKVNLLKKADDGSEKTSGRKLLSLLVNTVIRKNNPAKGEDPLQAQMFFERDKNKSLINFMWKTVFSGIKSTAIKSKAKLKRESETQKAKTPDPNSKKDKKKRKGKK